jgi:hypothetical protein
MLEAYEAERADFQRLVAALRRLQGATVEDLQSLDWLVGVIREVGLVPIPEAERTYAAEAESLNSSNQGLIQLPREFARYLLLLGEQRPASYLEIGTFNGATAGLAAAYLRRLRTDFRAVTIDVYPHFLFAREIQPLLPWLEYRVPCTSFDVRRERFEAVFIDGDHSFEWAWADYENVGRRARICAFHDVNNAPYREMNLGGVPAVWELLKQTEAAADFHEIFEHPTEPLMGIGVRVGARGSKIED